MAILVNIPKPAQQKGTCTHCRKPIRRSKRQSLANVSGKVTYSAWVHCRSGRRGCEPARVATPTRH